MTHRSRLRTGTAVMWNVFEVGDVAALRQVLVAIGVWGATILKVDSARMEGTGGVRGYHLVCFGPCILAHSLVGWCIFLIYLTCWLDFGVDLAWWALPVCLAQLADIEVVLVAAHLVSKGLRFFNVLRRLVSLDRAHVIRLVFVVLRAKHIEVLDHGQSLLREHFMSYRSVRYFSFLSTVERACHHIRT